MGKSMKQEIFAAAIEMFSTMGYTESTMRELAKRVGIKPASLYYHYASKEVLLDEIFDYFFINDKKYRMPSSNNLITRAAALSAEEILAATVVTYIDDEDFLLMNKILRIAIGYQFENQKARDVFNYIYYEMALNSREQFFLTLIQQKVLMPFDVKAIAYIITSHSLALFMQCANQMLPMAEFNDIYNHGMRELVHTIAPLICKYNG